MNKQTTTVKFNLAIPALVVTALLFVLKLTVWSSLSWLGVMAPEIVLGVVFILWIGFLVTVFGLAIVGMYHHAARTGRKVVWTRTNRHNWKATYNR